MSPLASDGEQQAPRRPVCLLWWCRAFALSCGSADWAAGRSGRSGGAEARGGALRCTAGCDRVWKEASRAQGTREAGARRDAVWRVAPARPGGKQGRCRRRPAGAVERERTFGPQAAHTQRCRAGRAGTARDGVRRRRAAHGRVDRPAVGAVAVFDGRRHGTHHCSPQAGECSGTAT